MSVFKKTAYFLGLGPDEDYDMYDDHGVAPAAEPLRAAPAQDRPVRAVAPAVEEPTVRVVPNTVQRPTVRPVPASEPSGSVRVVSNPNPSKSTAPKSVQPEDIQPAVRIVESRPASPHALSPTSFNEAQVIGDRFKSGQPVIVNLEGAERDLRRRLVDFASGLCYGLGGKMDRVADNVFLLTPDDVEVSEAETQRALR